MDIFQIFGISIVTAVLAVTLANYRKDFAVVLSVAAGCVLFIGVLSNLLAPLGEIRGYITASGISSSYMTVVLKALAIGYLTQFAADTCRDFGQSSVAARAELAGKAAIFIISLPLIKDIFAAVSKLVGK